MLTDKGILEKYGKAGDAANLTTIVLPYPMRLAWDTHSAVTKITCHSLIAQKLVSAFEDILNEYGRIKISEMGIDLYGGCVNVRLMRGSKTKWSRHSWGIAIDLDPARNQLKQDHTTAQFAKEEYKPMINIFYKHGFIGLGPEQDRDWMHFEINE